ncbi:hypothetical protein J6590_005184 [Homalodisca vitripennis]|nr:hypothetical protein J6590_005184 [Homalodisca vitripennis]
MTNRQHGKAPAPDLATEQLLKYFLTDGDALKNNKAYSTRADEPRRNGLVFLVAAYLSSPPLTPRGLMNYFCMSSLFTSAGRFFSVSRPDIIGHYPGLCRSGASSLDVLTHIACCDCVAINKSASRLNVENKRTDVARTFSRSASVVL